MLVLLSSGARKRFREDIVRAMALPQGMEVRFRYATEHVDSAVMAALAEKTIVGRECLLCYVDVSEPARRPFVVPCRFGTVAHAELVGSSLVLTLKVEAFVEGLDDRELRAHLTPCELTLVPEYQSGSSLIGKFAFVTAAALGSHRATGTAGLIGFERTAEALREVGFSLNGADVPFFHVRSILDLAGGRRRSERRLTVKAGRYDLLSGGRYALEIYSFSPQGGGQADTSELRVSTTDSEVKFGSDAVLRIDARYDLHRVRFAVEQRSLSVQAALRVAIGVPAPASEGLDRSELAEVSLELRFAGSLPLAIARVVMIAAGAAAPAIIGAYAAQKGSAGLYAVMLAAALIAGLATVYPNLKR